MSDRKAEGIEATNQAFRRYDQVEKRQEYHLAEAHHVEAFDEETRIPTCDLARFLQGDERDRQSFAEELGDALRRLGFAILEGHGVDTNLYDDADERILELFTEVPLEAKMRHRAHRFGSVNQGYFPIKETSDIHPDLVEGWVFCRRAFDLDGDPAFRAGDFWPGATWEPVFRRLVRAHEALMLPV
ncbi:MAG TPA: 2-oxoglutarate and iron-dependent oxygenase domain-containing protein, partial [Myxococcaceae bacterium]|nr:2-oxoglutarate and iron-dependent oxygenase domain-containing protein [Myxococcaceae bacterium]